MVSDKMLSTGSDTSKLQRSDKHLQALRYNLSLRAREMNIDGEVYRNAQPAQSAQFENHAASLLTHGLGNSLCTQYCHRKYSETCNLLAHTHSDDLPLLNGETASVAFLWCLSHKILLL
jgi:hypothetical protein